MRSIDSLAAFDELLAAETAVVFLWAPWSVSCLRSRPRVDEAERRFVGNAWAIGRNLTWWEFEVDFGSADWQRRFCDWLDRGTMHGGDWLYNAGAGTLLRSRAGVITDCVVSAGRVPSVFDWIIVTHSRSGA